MRNKKLINFTESFLVSLKEFADDVIKQPVIINKAYWEAVNIERMKREDRRREKQKYYSTINRLSKYGYLIKDRKNNQLSLKLTEKGLIKIHKISWKMERKKKKKIKNNQLCIVVFDIPERKRKMRDLFRMCLYELGFNRFQKSVFITHNDVVKEVKDLIKNCMLDDYVKLLTGKKI